MKTSYSRLLCTIVGVLAMFGSQPTFADDSEVFTSSSFTSGGVQANVLFIIDTSGSMDAEVILYNSATNYTPPTGGCDPAYIYWQAGTHSTPPDCGTTNRIPLNMNRCQAAYNGMVAEGWWSGRAAQISATDSRGRSQWGNLTASVTNRKVECRSDRERHGDQDASLNDGGNAKYARSGNGTESRWTGTRGNELNWDDRTTYSFYSANYINWHNTAEEDLPAGEEVIKTRMQIVKDVATGLIDDLEGVNLGIMRYSNNGGCGRDNTDDEYEAQGGMVTYPVSALNETTRREMNEQINGWEPAGWTPLSETLYEAYEYLQGGEVIFGDNSSVRAADYEDDCEADYATDVRDRETVYPWPSVAGSREGDNAASNDYDSPMDFSCQQTFIVYLTDGLPTQDTQVNSVIEDLPGFTDDAAVPETEGGGPIVSGERRCPANGPSNNADGRCMVNFAAYLHNHDLRPDITGEQTVTTYVVGFGSDIAESADYLDQIAAAGGGEAYTQGDSAGLRAALEDIFARVKRDANTTFVSPTVAVNAFNRTRNLDTLYISVFAPTSRAFWPGNLKKYRLVDGAVHGATGAAVNPGTGFFSSTSKDLFNDGAADGANVRLGGAASQLPDWEAREMYTYLGGAERDLTQTVNRFEVANTGIRYDHLGLLDATNRDAVIEYTLGLDIPDTDGDLDTTETRKSMGDPMHARPAVAIYGGDEENPDGTVYMTTNEGVLHAFDLQSGEERWSFIPNEMLQRLNLLMRNRTAATRNYGVDGEVRVFKYDINGNGIIESGDKMYLVFGFGRGGDVYYALDVTNQEAPRFMWKKSRSQLPMLGQAWSTPQITRVNVGAGQTDPQKFVMIFGAGYDTAQESYRYTRDSVGNGIYMLELSTGNLLWSGGQEGTPGVNWEHTEMNNAIPAEIAILDLNDDTFADRMYAGDMGGRIWRFDIWHGQEPDLLVTGGVLATLGVGHTNPANPAATAVLQESRRFYNSPDVSLVTARGAAPFLNIAIGSGYRGHPLETDTRDRFYSIRDYRPFQRLLDDAYTSAGGWTPITDGSLVNVTTDVNAVVPDGSNGWKIEMSTDGWVGEKILADSVTVGGVIFFPTFTPTGVSEDDPCLPATLNRTWAVYLDSARPFGLLDGQNPGTGNEAGGWARDPRSRFERNFLEGIAPGSAVIMADDQPVCLSAGSQHKCPAVGGVERTFWERRQ